MPSFSRKEEKEMRRIVWVLCLAIIIAAIGVTPVLAKVNYPEPKGYVNDFANIISAEVEQRLEATLSEHEKQTTNEIAVVTVVSLEGLSIEDYAMGLAEKWGVGKNNKDNGVILLVAPNERAVRIEVGYGLESVLTDARAKSIIEKTITPKFKGGDYDSGIEKGITEIIKVITSATATSALPTEKQETKSSSAGLIFGIVVMGIVLVIGLILLIAWLSRVVKRWREEIRRREAIRRRTKELAETVENSLAQTLSDIEKLGGGDR